MKSEGKARVKVFLMGVSYGTGNLGVSALAEGAIQGFLAAEPAAEITIWSDGDREPRTARIEHGGREATVRVLPVRYGKRFWKRDHIAMLYARAAGLPLGGGGDDVFAAIAGADVIADLSGGDSFTDIYGVKRMALQTAFKRLPVTMGKKLVLLPQTIGPFDGALSRRWAGGILRRAALVYTRDVEGVEEANRIAGVDLGAKLRFAPDVGFLVEPREPANAELRDFVTAKAARQTVVGVNVSGLLYSGGYTGANQFGLKADYRRLILGMVKEILADRDAFVLLVPHVITTKGHVEDDVTACETLVGELGRGESQRVRVVAGGAGYGVREAKWVIGQCAFFAGARMHACIAALSQGVPAVGIAYSRKFRGVFETMGVADAVADPRESTEEEIVRKVIAEYAGRDGRRAGLAAASDAAKGLVLKALADVLREGRS